MDNLGRFPNNIKQLAWLNKNAIAMFNYEDVDRHSVKYGSQNEPKAIKAYELQTGQKVAPSGMWIFPDSPLYSCSDGILYSKQNVGAIDGVIEVK